MLLKSYIKILAAMTLLGISFATCANVYMRDYTHRAGDADSKISSRAIALDHVKKLLLEEIGVHVRSSMEITKTNDGAQYAAEEIETLTAGVVSVVVVQEKWNGLTYYLQAKMEADPDDVLKAIEQFKNRDANLAEQLELERRALKEAREELAKYKEGFSSYEGEGLTKATKSYDKNVKVIQAYDYVERGIQLSRSGNYIEAAELLSEAHKLGNERATIVLATMYMFGNGVKLDKSKANDLLKNLKESIREKAEQGETFYQNVLGIMYNLGVGGISEDNANAIVWFEKAAEKNFFPALLNLASVYYDTGKYDLVIEQYEKLIDMNNPQGYYYLAGMYTKGVGVPVDKEKAADLYARSAQLGFSQAITVVASFYLTGNGEHEVDYDKALQLFRKAAEMGSSNAYAGIANIYLGGHGVKKDVSKAYEYHKKGAEHGSRISYHYLGDMYMTGVGVPRDLNKARYWYTKGVEVGNTRSKMALEYLRTQK
jgi:TPR repeat protein